MKKLPDLFYDASIWLPLIERATEKTYNDYGVNNLELTNGKDTIRMAYNMPKADEGALYGLFNFFNYATFSWTFDQESIYKYYRLFAEDYVAKPGRLIFPHDPNQYSFYGTSVPTRFSNISIAINGFIDAELDIDYLLHEITIFKLTLDNDS